MKKTKLIGLAGLLLSLGVVGCGENDQPDNPDEPAQCEHEWSDWKTDATKHWKECSKCGEKKSEAEHKYSSVAKDQTGVTRATCVADGKVKKACTCGLEQIVDETKLGHDMQDAGAEAEGYVAANCQQEGVMPTKCSRCTETGTRAIEQTDHNYEAVTEADAAAVAASGKVAKAATCEEDGVSLSICHGCNDVKETTIAALGHKPVTTDTAAPAAGKAAVRVYTCKNGCGETYFGFKATEVSPNAGKLVFEPAEPAEGEEQGARFWGRPIGNAMELGEDGSASGADAEKVFDETVKGDLFEYVFDLTQEQLNAIGSTCLLYCDAKPADYLSGDFWACDPSAEEWTPGYYIEGEHKGEAIADYRYILYVDDQPVEFDKTMSAPIKGRTSSYSSSNSRAEYVMPYKFHLHTGTNKISLRMAGGYRSLFYNFTFRKDPDAVHEHNFGEGTPVAATETYCAATKKVCSCGDTQYIWAAKGTTATIQNFNEDATGGFIKSAASTNGSETTAPEDSKRAIVTYNVNVDKAQAVNTLSFEVNRNSSSAASWFGTESGDNTKYYEADPANPGTYIRPAYRWIVKVNGKEVKFTGNGGKQTTKSKMWVDFTLENFALKAGVNTISIETTGGYSVEIYNWKLSCHDHDWVNNKCSCGATRVALKAIADATFTVGGNKDGTPDGFLKLNANNDVASYSFAAEAAGNATIVVEAAMDSWSGNKSKSMYSRKSGTGCNIEIKVGENALDLSSFESKTYGTLFPDTDPIANGHSGLGTIELGTIAVAEGNNTLTVKRIDSYNILIKTIYIVF